MKILILKGNQAGKYQRPYLDLAQVWLDDKLEVHVHAIRPEYEEFAREVKWMIDERLANPKTPIFTRVASTYHNDDGSTTHADRLRFTKPEDPDFLESLIGDTVLWPTDGDIEGYSVRSGASEVLEVADRR